MRASKTVNGKIAKYYSDGTRLIHQCDGDNTHDPDGRLGLVFQCDIADGAKHYYYPVTNSRGDIMEIHNGPGQITAKYNYDAWGKLLSVTDANGNVLPKTHFAYKISVRYRGYEYDSETGLYYLQSRYYDPETGRFINADDAEYIGSSGNAISFNAFAYCENDPVNDSDPSGTVSIEIVVGALYGMALSVVSLFLDLILENPKLLKSGIKSISSAFTNKIKQNPGKFILDVVFGALSGAISTTNKARVLSNIITFIDSIRQSHMDGYSITKTVILLIVDFIFNSIIDSSQSFSKFKFKRVINHKKSLKENIKSLNWKKLKNIAKIITNQIVYYLKSNKTLYKRYIKKYSLSAASSWIYRKF